MQMWSGANDWHKQAGIERVHALIGQSGHRGHRACAYISMRLGQALLHLLLVGDDGDLDPGDDVAELLLDLGDEDVPEVLEPEAGPNRRPCSTASR